MNLYPNWQSEILYLVYLAFFFPHGNLIQKKLIDKNMRNKYTIYLFLLFNVVVELSAKILFELFPLWRISWTISSQPNLEHWYITFKTYTDQRTFAVLTQQALLCLEYAIYFHLMSQHLSELASYYYSHLCAFFSFRLQFVYFPPLSLIMYEKNEALGDGKLPAKWLTTQLGHCC